MATTANFEYTTQPMMASFNSGEFTPLLWNRVKFERYSPGAMLLQNFIVTKHGPYFRRSGTLFVDYARRVNEKPFDEDKKRLKRFIFNRDQVYILEFGHKSIRFFTYDASGSPIKIVNGDGSDYVVTTPYTAEQLVDLRFTQSMDTVYLTHYLYAPRTLVRKASSNWVFDTYKTNDGPYDNGNLDTTKTMQVGATTGTGVALTANFDVFTSEMVGRCVRVTVNKKPGWGRISAVTDLRNAKIDIVSAINATTATSNWYLGAWYGTEGDSTKSHYPAAVSFHMERLYFGGGLYTPQTVWGSRPGDFPTFSPTTIEANSSGTADLVTDDMAVSFNLATDELNAIVWLKSTDSLYIGTIGPEFKLTVDASDVITPSNFQFKRISNYGSSRVEPQFIGNSIIFTQSSLRTLRELSYNFSTDKYIANDISLLGEHLTAIGLSSYCYQQEPNNIIWGTQRVVSNNLFGENTRQGGLLIGLTYDKEQNVTAWHRHVLGGTEVEVESAECVFNSSIQQDQLWLSVRRKLNGSYVRTMEVMEKDFRVDTPLNDIYFVDCGSKYNAYKLAQSDPNYGKAITTISGLNWLANETVQVTVDGGQHPDCVVSSDGKVTLQYPGKFITIGLQMISKYQSLYIDPEVGGTSSAQGFTQNITQAQVRFYRTIGGELGPSFDALEPIQYRTPQDAMDTALPLFTGEKVVIFSSSYNMFSQVCIQQTFPLPMTVMAVIPKIQVNKV